MTTTTSTCNICLEDFCVDDSIVKHKCRHEFHYYCWNKVKSKSRCPVCRAELYVDEDDKLEEELERIRMEEQATFDMLTGEMAVNPFEELERAIRDMAGGDGRPGRSYVVGFYQLHRDRRG